MKRTVAMALVILGATMPLAVWAQDDVIDLFDNQDSMSSSGITIDGESSGGSDLGLGGSVPGALTLKFERSDRSLLVPTTINGTAVYMMFDTGATLTAIDQRFLQRVGLMPGKSAPTTMVSTANGPSLARFGVIDSLKVGNRIHSGVSFLTCAACPSGTFKGKPIVGLLGLNVLNRYRYSIDESKGTIELVPTSAYNNRMRDIEPWLQVQGGQGIPSGEYDTIVKFDVENRSKRDVKEMIFEVQCSNGKSARLKPIRIPRKKTKSVNEMVKIRNCGRARIQALGGRW